MRSMRAVAQAALGKMVAQSEEQVGVAGVVREVADLTGSTDDELSAALVDETIRGGIT
jgi:hypothetical protein